MRCAGDTRLKHTPRHHLRVCSRSNAGAAVHVLPKEGTTVKSSAHLVLMVEGSLLRQQEPQALIVARGCCLEDSARVVRFFVVFCFWPLSLRSGGVREHDQGAVDKKLVRGRLEKRAAPKVPLSWGRLTSTQRAAHSPTALADSRVGRAPLTMVMSELEELERRASECPRR